jgi:hypothetical protein
VNDDTTGRPVRIPVEPAADQRRLARTLFATYVALLDVGFDESQAMTIVVAMVTSVTATTTVERD